MKLESLQGAANTKVVLAYRSGMTSKLICLLTRMRAQKEVPQSVFMPWTRRYWPSLRDTRRVGQPFSFLFVSAFLRSAVGRDLPETENKQSLTVLAGLGVSSAFRPTSSARKPSWM